MRIQNNTSHLANKHVAFQGNKMTLTSAFTRYIRELNYEFPEIISSPSLNDKFYQIFVVGGTVGTCKVLSSIIKLPVKMAERACCELSRDIIGETPILKGVLNMPVNAIKGGVQSLRKDARELREFIEVLGNDLTTRMSLKGQRKQANILRKRIF